MAQMVDYLGGDDFGAPTQTVATTAPATTTATAGQQTGTIRDYQGNTYDTNTIIKLASQVAQNFQGAGSSGGVYSTQGQSVGFDYKDLTNAIGRAPSVGEQVVFDIARQLSQNGITDVSQIKVVPLTYESDAGTTTINQIVGPNNEPITLEGTYTGKGGTVYNIQADASGKPTFTTQGVSSSDVPAEIIAVATMFIAPQLGAQIASLLGSSTVVGTAIASTALQVATGVPVDQAIKNAIASAVIQTGSPAIATEINSSLKTVVSDTFLRETISNAAGSAVASGLTAAARGGNTTDIINSAVAGAAGSGVASYTDSRELGAAVAGGLTGGVTGAIMGAAGSLASEAARPSTPEQKTSSTQTVQEALASADLTPEERTAVEQAIQDVYAQASTAQALPSTATDAATGTSRMGSPFAANDPRFLAALQKNPGLAKAFSEYTNTYGFTTPVEVYKTLLEQELVKTPTDPTLLEEFKRITGSDYSPAQSPVYQLQTQYIPVPGYQAEITTAPGAFTDRSTTFGAAPGIAPETFPTARTSAVPGVTPEAAPSATPTERVSPLTETPPVTRPAPLSDQNLISALGVVPEVVPGAATAPVPSPAPAPVTSTGVAPLPQPVPAAGATPTPTGPGGTGTARPPSPIAGPIDTIGTADQTTQQSGFTYPDTYSPIAQETLPEVSETKPVAPEVTETVETDVEPEEKKAPAEKKQPTYRAGLLTSTTVTRPSSPLVRALQNEYYPLSSTGLTAYRPAGEIESEETGKERQDVWNEASLRLKDALGL